MTAVLENVFASVSRNYPEHGGSKTLCKSENNYKYVRRHAPEEYNIQPISDDRIPSPCLNFLKLSLNFV